MRVAGGVLGPETEVEVAERDPAGLPAPAHVDDPRLEGEQPAERGDRVGRRLLLEARPERESARRDLEHARDPSPRPRTRRRPRRRSPRRRGWSRTRAWLPARLRTVDSTRAAEGCTPSRLGPTVPVAPASASVWHDAAPGRGEHGATLLELRLRRRAAVCRLVRLEHDRERDHGQRRGDRDGPDRAAAVAEVVEEAHRGAQHHQRDEDQPGALAAGEEREVPGEHRQQHRQRQVVVVHRALLAPQAGARVGLAARLLGADQLPVCGDDHEQDVRGHHGAEHRPHLQPGRPRREQLARAPGRERGERQDRGAERRARALRARGRARRRRPRPRRAGRR